MALACALLALLAGCRHTASPSVPRPSVPIVPAVMAPPGSRPLPAPTPKPIVEPAEKDRFVFSFPPGPEARLAIFEKASEDIYVYPGAGKGMSFTFTVGADQYMFQKDGAIQVYDHARELLITMWDPEISGLFAFAPTTDYAYNLYFLAAPPARAATFTGNVFVQRPASESTPYPWNRFEKAHELIELSAVGAVHGGISSFAVNGAGDVLVFTTADGLLFEYRPKRHEVLEIRIQHEDGPGHASSVGIDFPWGRYVVWEDSLKHQIFLLDRWTGEVDPLPIANLILNATAIRFPFFSGFDPWHIFFSIFLPNGDERVYRYDIRTEQTDTLTLRNGFLD